MIRYDRTRWLSSFDSIEAINAWLLCFGVFVQDKVLQDMWGARQFRLNSPEHTVIDYKFEIQGRQDTKPFVKYTRKFWRKIA